MEFPSLVYAVPRILSLVVTHISCNITLHALKSKLNMIYYHIILVRFLLCVGYYTSLSIADLYYMKYDWLKHDFLL